MEGLFSWIHRGDDGGTGAGPQVSRFASTRQVLGEGLWYLTFQQNLPSIPAGTAIGVDFTGTLTDATGVITVTLAVA